MLFILPRSTQGLLRVWSKWGLFLPARVSEPATAFGAIRREPTGLHFLYRTFGLGSEKAAALVKAATRVLQ